MIIFVSFFARNLHFEVRIRLAAEFHTFGNPRSMLLPKCSPKKFGKSVTFKIFYHWMNLKALPTNHKRSVLAYLAAGFLF